MKNWQQIREEVVRNSRFKPLTPKHQLYLHAIETNDIVFCTGPAGTGKTTLAVKKALEMLESDRPIKKVIITRPLVECGPKMGFLPGNAKEKFEPFVRPILDSMLNFIEQEKINQYLAHKTIELVPLGLMRGLSLHNTFVIADEMQNAEYSEIKMLLTRLGESCRFIIAADIKQSDIFNKPPLLDIITKIRHIDSIQHIILGKEDILRSGLVQKILDVLED